MAELEPNTEREIHSIWYRSLLEDGTLWCESRSLEEVKRVSQGTRAIIQESITYVIYGKWNTIDETNPLNPWLCKCGTLNGDNDSCYNCEGKPDDQE